jgi:hypothetical protein
MTAEAGTGSGPCSGLGWACAHRRKQHLWSALMLAQPPRGACRAECCFWGLEGLEGLAGNQRACRIRDASSRTPVPSKYLCSDFAPLYRSHHLANNLDSTVASHSRPRSTGTPRSVDTLFLSRHQHTRRRVLPLNLAHPPNEPLSAPRLQRGSLLPLRYLH